MALVLLGCQLYQGILRVKAEWEEIYKYVYSQLSCFWQRIPLGLIKIVKQKFACMVISQLNLRWKF